jgi:hypothetical protein
MMMKLKMIINFKSKRPSPLMTRTIATIFVLLLSASAFAQTEKSLTAPEPAPPIQDNSFLIEEAYNQEPGVIQHISFFSRQSQNHSWVYTFTQEWPINGIKNQFSYTLGATHAGEFPGSGAGIGDTALNYRYQLVGSGETRLAIAPRFSVLIPSGDPQYGRGYGGTGLQTNTAISFVLNKHLVSHTNLGATWVPNATDAIGEQAATVGYNLGQSFIWLAHPRFNVMLETTYSDNEGIAGPSKTQRSKDLLMSPGVRWAYNFKNGLQIVPGVAVPLGVGPSSGDKGVILYLSFEHPWPWLVKKQTH